MPFPSIPAIYLRDTLSFLKRIKMEEMRLVSCRIDDVITDLPTRKLPKYRLEALQFYVDTSYIHIWEDGHAIGPCYLVNNPKNWRELSKSWGCCLELKESSLLLVGQLLCAEAEPHSVLCLSMVGKRGKIKMRAVNRMTETTAFDIFHLLHHLHDVAFGWISLNAGPAFARPLQVLSNFNFGGASVKKEPFRLHTFSVRCHRCQSIMDGGESAMAVIFHANNIDLTVEGKRNLPTVLELITTGGRHWRRLGWWDKLDWLDSTHLRDIVKHFEEHSANTLRGIIPCVCITSLGLLNWRATFPEEDAVSIFTTKYGDCQYEFGFTHAKSGKPFRLIIKCNMYSVRVYAPVVRLQFS